MSAHVRQRQLVAHSSTAPSSSEANGVRVVRHVLKVGEARGVHDRPALLAVEGVAIGAILAAGKKVEGGMKSSGHWLITNQESAQFSAQRGDKRRESHEPELPVVIWGCSQGRNRWGA